MENDLEPISPELQKQLDQVVIDVEAEEKKNSRFDMQKAKLVGLFCLGLAFTFGIAMRAGFFKALIFGVIGGLIGFITAGCQRQKKKNS